MKRLLASGVFLVLIGACDSVATSGGGDKDIAIERGGMSFRVPQRYLYKNRFPWIHEAVGLDSSESSFMVRIPSSEIEEYLPRGVLVRKPDLNEIILVIHVLTVAEKQEMVDGVRRSFYEIVRRNGLFKNAYAERDEEFGWFRVFRKPGKTSRWYVFRHSPYLGEKSIEDGSLIALCSEDKHTGRYCTLTIAIIGRMAIEMSLRYEHLPYREEILGHVVDRLNSWQE